ncbi:hypothetical protein ACC806_34500 [Rhizobium ruizarguesonis]
MGWKLLAWTIYATAASLLIAAAYMTGTLPAAMCVTAMALMVPMMWAFSKGYPGHPEERRPTISTRASEGPPPPPRR